MTKPLRGVSVVAMMLIIALMININYLQGVEADNLKTKPGNGRQIYDQYNRDRGPIIAGAETLARSKDTGKTLRYQRVYKSAEIFAPVTGHYTTYSKTGIERAADSLLDGTDKRLTLRRWLDTLTGKPPVGATVETTINPRAQRIAYHALTKSTSRRAAAVALDPRSGAILVMANTPSYDTNDVAINDGRKANAAFKRYERNTVLKPMLNKAMDETFPPGSAFKTVVSAAYLSAGNSATDSVPAPSSYLLPGTTTALPNSHEGGACGGVGRAPLIRTFAESCNTTFAVLANAMGNQAVADQARKFGFGTEINVEPGMDSAVSRWPTEVDDAQTALAAVGQGSTTATPLQMAMVAAAVANKGRVMKPYLVGKVTAPNRSELFAADRKRLSRAMPAAAANQLKEMMIAVVREGTAQGRLAIPAGGKTGTADIDGASYNARWFVGFAPAENPRVAVAVVTEGEASGGEVAAPIASQIMRAVLSK